MTEILSLGKSEYLGSINYIRDIDGLTASTLTADPDELKNDSLHFHENPIVSFIVEGDSFERIGKTTNIRSAGDLRFYRAGELHQVKIKRHPSRNINFELTPRFLASQDFSENSLGLALENNSNAKLVFLRTYKELCANDAFTDSSIQILLYSLMAEACPVSKRKKPQWIDKLRDLLNDRWSEPLTLANLSQTLNVHPVTISKYFTRYFGCSYGEYMCRLRVDKSLTLIKNSRRSLTEIAHQCGFTDQSHFTRNFKGLTGFRPKDFRKF